jgi:hypothetical protein
MGWYVMVDYKYIYFCFKIYIRFLRGIYKLIFIPTSKSLL